MAQKRKKRKSAATNEASPTPAEAPRTEPVVTDDRASHSSKNKKQKQVDEASSQETPLDQSRADPESSAVNQTTDPGSTQRIRKIIVVMEEACLEPVKTSKGNFELLNCDDHLYLHKKLNKNPTDSRPDVLHQCLLALIDSPLNKAGHLQVYVRSNQNVLFEISPATRIPRTFKRFSGLMVQLIHKMKIKAVNGNTTLLKVIKNPITRHLPPNALIFGTSVTGELVDTHIFTAELKDDRPYVFVFGAFAKGHLEPEYATKMLSFSEYPLSAACAISRLLNGFERKWDIL